MVRLQLARLSDATRIASLSRRLIEADLPWCWTPPRVRRLLREPGTNAYLAMKNGELAGFCIATLAARQAHLVLLAVVPAFQRQGVGKTLVDWQRKAAITAGIPVIALEVRSRNREARLFYQHIGFRFVCDLPCYYCRREDAVRMTLTPLCRPVPTRGPADQ